MPTTPLIVELPAKWRKSLPPGLHQRLHDLLDKQDDGQKLTRAERREAEELVELNEILSLARINALARHRGMKA
jgi:hypothetical protein